MLKCWMEFLYLLKLNLQRKFHKPEAKMMTLYFSLFSTYGQYNCKSGYRFLKDLKARSDEDTQLDLEKKFQKSIWSLEVPNKYKNIVCRASRNSLPTKLNLTQKTIIKNPTCDRCSSTIEDSLHALWSCSGLDEVWDGDRWSFRLREVFVVCKELCRQIMENEKSRELFAVQVQSIWHQRNQT